MVKRFVTISHNVLLLQTVACRKAKLSEFARTMQAQNNNNQSLMKLLIVVAVITSAFYYTKYYDSRN